jgi:hypothetical protein
MVRVVFTIFFFLAAASAMAAFPVGTTVLASPQQMNSIWKRCKVLGGPERNDYYPLECVDEIAGPDDKKRLIVSKTSTPGKWIKADDPSFRPDLQLDKARAQVAQREAAAKAPPKAAPPDGTAKVVAKGSYECWGNGQARMLLNFTVTGGGSYKASDGSSGRFTYDTGSKQIKFTGYLKQAMPEGFTTIYYEPKGRPTVSFRSARGSEASFCELVTKK